MPQYSLLYIDWVYLVLSYLGWISTALSSPMRRMTHLHHKHARSWNRKKWFERMLPPHCRWTVRFHLARLHMLLSRYFVFYLNGWLLFIPILQLIFNLWDTSSWIPAHARFDFHACYCFIVDFFDAARGTNAKAQVRELLDWWNKFVGSFLFRCTVLTYISSGRYFQLVELMPIHPSQHLTKPWRLSEPHERDEGCNGST